jgi:hypothetical protein
VVRVHPAFTLTALGTRVRVEIQDGSLSDEEFARLRAMWAACGAEDVASSTGSGRSDLADVTVRRRLSTSASGAREIARSGDDGVEWPTSGSFRSLSDHLASDVTAAAITHAQGRLVMLHAATLADPDTGRTLFFVGRSGAGKTTISRTLGRHLRYLSDETAGIAADGRIAPYPKPLSVRVGDDERPKRQIPPAELDLLPVDGVDARAHRVVVLERSPDAPARAEVRPLAVTEAIAAVTSEVSFLNALNAPLQRLAAVCALGGGPVLVRYRDAADLELALPELLVDRDESPAWTAVEVDPVEHAVAATEAAVRGVRRTPATDAVADEAGLVVLRDGVVHALAGIGPFLWINCRRPATVAELTAATVAEFGDPGGEPESVVQAAIEQLMAGGLLEWCAG